MSDEIFQISEIMNRYYEKVGKAAAGEGSCPVFTTFEAGYGFVDENVPEGEIPVLSSVPADLEEIPNVFYTGDVEAQYSNGATIAKCEIPTGALPSPQKCSVIGIKDQFGDLVAVCVTLPDWVTPTEAYITYPTINFPMKEV